MIYVRDWGGKMSKTKRKTKKKDIKIIASRGKRKRAIARVFVKTKGKGNIKINGVDWKVYFNAPFYQAYFNSIINRAEKLIKNLDIDVNVNGGGIVGQLQAVTTGIARALIQLDYELKGKVFEDSILKEDIRRVEPKKDRRRKARAKFQKSYR